MAGADHHRRVMPQLATDLVTVRRMPQEACPSLSLRLQDLEELLAGPTLL